MQKLRHIIALLYASYFVKSEADLCVFFKEKRNTDLRAPSVVLFSLDPLSPALCSQ